MAVWQSKGCKGETAAAALCVFVCVCVCLCCVVLLGMIGRQGADCGHICSAGRNEVTGL